MTEAQRGIETVRRVRPPEQEPRGCRWISGDPLRKGWRYCQCRPAEDSPYCPEHHARAYRPAPSEGA